MKEENKMELKERKDIDDQYKWNLSSLFVSDEAYESAVNAIDEKVAPLANYQGKLSDAKTIKEFLDLYMNVQSQIFDIYTYASLRKVEDTRDNKANAMVNSAYSKVVLFNSVTSYFKPEILALDDATLDTIVNDEVLKEYKVFLLELIRTKSHTLSSKEENVLATLTEVLNLPGDISSTLTNADLLFDSAEDSNGNSNDVSNATYILLQNSKDRVLRENSFKSFYKTYKEHINTLGATYLGCMKASYAEAKLRGYKSTLEMRLDQDNIPELVYDNLINTVHGHMDYMYRYVKLRKRLLKLDSIHYYDLYTPLVEDSSKEYTYEQAQQIVLDTVKPLGEEYVSRVQKAYDENWIDVYPNIGKESGAFSSGTYSTNPVIKLNFTGTLDNVSTLAHEMGHSQHSWLTNHTQPFQYSGYTMFVAEVASTVNENLMVEHLLKGEDDLKEQLALYNQLLEGYKGTVYRQTMFAEFERESHKLYESGEPVSVETLNQLYLDLIKLYFGEELEIDEEVKYEWARIPHFYYLFYVYVYATGFSSAAAISQMITEGKPNAVENYLKFLTTGSSLPPLEELKIAGVDLTTSEPIEIALNKFNDVLSKCEEIADKLGL